MDRDELDYQTKLLQLSEAHVAAKEAFYDDPNEETLAAKMSAGQELSDFIDAHWAERNPGNAIPPATAGVKEN